MNSEVSPENNLKKQKQTAFYSSSAQATQVDGERNGLMAACFVLESARCLVLFCRLAI